MSRASSSLTAAGRSCVPASSPTDYTTRTDDSKAAGLCAEELAKREMPATEKAELTNDDAAIAQ